jgi:hypothetical protein
MNAKDLRNPEFRAIQGINNPAGEINEMELSQLAGTGDAQIQTTWACGIAVSLALCPTTKCTSQC